jgi:hypothetical protein
MCARRPASHPPPPHPPGRPHLIHPSNAHPGAPSERAHLLADPPPRNVSHQRAICNPPAAPIARNPPDFVTHMQHATCLAGLVLEIFRGALAACPPALPATYTPRDRHPSPSLHPTPVPVPVPISGESECCSVPISGESECCSSSNQWRIRVLVRVQ